MGVLETIDKRAFFLLAGQATRPEKESETDGNGMTTCHIRMSVISRRLVFGTPFVGRMADDSIQDIH